MMSKWLGRMFEMAELVSSWSKDPSSGVGAVIARGNIIVSVGFNGFAKGVEDTPKRLQNRDIKYKLTIHAEENAIIFANSQNLEDCTLYCTHPPCASCASKITQSKIKHVIFKQASKDFLSRWQDDYDLSMEVFKEAGVTILEI